MNEEITFALNDTTRVIMAQIEHIEKWRGDAKNENPKCNQAITDIIIEHLHIVKLLSLEMVESENYPR